MKLTKLLLLTLALSSTAVFAEQKCFDFTKGVSQASGSTVTLSLSQNDTLRIQCSNADGKKDNYTEFQFTDPTVLGVCTSGNLNENLPLTDDSTGVTTWKRLNEHYMLLVPQKAGTSTTIKCFAGKVQPEVGPQTLVHEQSSITVKVVE